MRNLLKALVCLAVLPLCAGSPCCKEFCVADCELCSGCAEQCEANYLECLQACDIQCGDNEQCLDPCYDVCDETYWTCETTCHQDCEDVCDDACDGEGEQWDWWWGCDEYY